MVQFAITLSTQQYEELQALAARYQITPEDLARAAVAELLAHPGKDFQRIVDYVLAKNAELYQRLA